MPAQQYEELGQETEALPPWKCKSKNKPKGNWYKQNKKYLDKARDNGGGGGGSKHGIHSQAVKGKPLNIGDDGIVSDIIPTRPKRR